MSDQNNYPVITGKIMTRSYKKAVPPDFPELPESLVVKGLAESTKQSMYKIKDLTDRNPISNISPKSLFKYYNAISPDYVISIHTMKDDTVVIAFNRYDLENPFMGCKVFILDLTAFMNDNSENAFVGDYYHTTNLSLDSFDLYNHHVVFADAQCDSFCYGYIDNYLYETEVDFQKLSDSKISSEIETDIMNTMLNQLFGIYILSHQLSFEIPRIVDSLYSSIANVIEGFNEYDQNFRQLIMELPSHPMYDLYDIKKLLIKVYKSYEYLKRELHENLKYTFEDSFVLPCMYYHSQTDYKFFMVTLIINARKQIAALDPSELSIFLSKKF